MVDITIHQNAVDSDDIYNVLPFCITVCDYTERVNLPLGSQDGVDVIDNFEVYLIEFGEGQRCFRVAWLASMMIFFLCLLNRSCRWISLLMPSMS